MNQRRTFLPVVALLALTGVTLFFLWPRETRLRLRIVRRDEENGKPVVFFRVEGSGQRRIIITEVHQIVGETWQIPSWASQRSPLSDPMKAGKKFGVLAPRNTSV